MKLPSFVGFKTFAHDAWLHQRGVPFRDDVRIVDSLWQAGPVLKSARGACAQAAAAAAAAAASLLWVVLVAPLLLYGGSAAAYSLRGCGSLNHYHHLPTIHLTHHAHSACLRLP